MYLRNEFCIFVERLMFWMCFLIGLGGGVFGMDFLRVYGSLC